VPVTIRIPRKTKSLRVVLQDPANGRIGTAELDQEFTSAKVYIDCDRTLCDYATRFPEHKRNGG
jgi:hypothetical protein